MAASLQDRCWERQHPTLRVRGGELPRPASHAPQAAPKWLTRPSRETRNHAVPFFSPPPQNPQIQNDPHASAAKISKGEYTDLPPKHTHSRSEFRTLICAGCGPRFAEGRRLAS
jgi:hypothetical protein